MRMRIVLSIVLALAVGACAAPGLGGADDVAADDQPDELAAAADAGVLAPKQPCPPGWFRGADGYCHPIPVDPWPDPPPEKTADPDAADGIGTSPLWWPWWCLPRCAEPGPTDTTGLAGDAGP